MLVLPAHFHWLSCWKKLTSFLHFIYSSSFSSIIVLIFLFSLFRCSSSCRRLTLWWSGWCFCFFQCSDSELKFVEETDGCHSSGLWVPFFLLFMEMRQFCCCQLCRPPFGCIEIACPFCLDIFSSQQYLCILYTDHRFCFLVTILIRVLHSMLTLSLELV